MENYMYYSQVDEVTALEILKKIHEVIAGEIQNSKQKFNDIVVQEAGNDSLGKTFRLIGNKTVGSEYELTMWKKVPMFETNIHRFSSKDKYFITISGLPNSESWRFHEKHLREKIAEKINEWISAFTVQNQESI